MSDKLLAKERKNNNNNNNNNKKRSKHNMSPKLRLGDIITFIFYYWDMYANSIKEGGM